MKHIEGTFKGVRSANIFYQAWLPEGGVKAVLLIVHGLGEHSGRYMNLVNHFVPLGYALYALDHFGHGKSEGRREYVDRFGDYTNTLTIYRNMVKGWQKDKPLFLVGHSMGGLISSHYLIDNQADVNGAVIFSPSVKVSETISPTLIIIGKILSVILPRLGVFSLDASGISRDPAVVAAHRNDPLVFQGKMSARLGAEMVKAMLRVTAETDRITLPLIILQGSKDSLVNPSGAQMLYDKVSSKDKTLKIYEGLYHELFNEPERAIVLKEMETWLTAHVQT